MGMTIDKIIKNINALNAICGQKDFYDKEFKESLTVAIDTMHKYEKIQEITKQKEYDNFNTHNYFGDFLRVQDIRKVIQYGSDN